MSLLLDVMCGTLATYLRMCGNDAAYALDRDVEADERLREIAADENRVLLTRDEEPVSGCRDCEQCFWREPLGASRGPIRNAVKRRNSLPSPVTLVDELDVLVVVRAGVTSVPIAA